MRHLLAALLAVAIGHGAPNAQPRTAGADLLLSASQPVAFQTSLVSSFDGRRINMALALELVGDLNLLSWGDCSARLGADGLAFIPEPGARAARVQPELPCVYLVTGTPEEFNEHFVVEAPCDDAGSRPLACLNGYAVDTRVRNFITTEMSDTEVVVTVERRLIVSEPALRRPARTAPSQRQSASSAPPALRMRRVLSSECAYTYRTLERRSECQVFDADGQLVAGPIVEVGYDYIAYQALNGDGAADAGQTSCAAFADFVEAGLDVTDDFAGEVYDTLEYVTTGSGALIGGARGGKEGAILGGAFGKMAFVPSRLAFEFIAPYRTALAGSIAEAACDASGIGDGPGGGDDTPPPVPPQNPDEVAPGAADTEGAMCWTCTRVREQMGTFYDSQGNVVETQTITTCIEWGWVDC